ncbi:MAG TPA: alpha/beta fold hydrolase [Thermoleophilaceae bacterium]|nr:alpha/beta fold hydrolase [Thermoleophilaceae bacterium]
MPTPRRIAAALATTIAVGLLAAPGALAAPGDLPATCDRITPETVEREILDETVQVISTGNAVITGSLYMPRQATQYAPVPVILMTHGGSSSRLSLNPRPGSLTQGLLDAGFAVLTYDSRGHGDSRRDSGGQATVRYEFGGSDGVEDVRRLVGLAGRCRAIGQEAPGDPVIGFVGASNGAGIQLNAAAAIPELDAIVPMLSWADLAQDLAPNDVPKVYGELAYQRFKSARVQIDPAIEGFHSDAVAGLLSGDTANWLAGRSTSGSAGRVRVPTLLLQGTLDTLFPLEGAMRNFERIRANGTPVKLVAFCTAHDAEAAPPRSCKGGSDMTDIIFRWLNHYLRGAEANLGSPIDWYGPDGRFRSADGITGNGTTVIVPKPAAKRKSRRKTRRTATRAMTRESARRATTRRRRATRPRRTRTKPLGTLRGPGGTGGDTQTYAAPAPSSEAAGTLRVRLVDRNRKGCRSLLGIPRVEISGVVDGPEAFLFAELQESNPQGERRTVNINTMPVRLSRGRFSAEFSLHGVSWILGLGNHLDLELTTGSDMYLEPSRDFTVRVDRVVAKLPLGAVGRGRSC